jgi:hypothetical protein
MKTNSDASGGKGAVELRINKPSLRFTPGQWVFIQVPSVSTFEWHPVRDYLISALVMP